VAESFIKRHVEANKLRTRDAIVYHLEKYVYPEWQHKPFRELHRGDVTTLLDHIEDKNGARTADMCLAIVRKMMNWYQSRNDDYTSPVVRGMGRYAPKDHKRKRILFKSLGNGQHDDDELVAFWNACRASNAATFCALMKMVLLTGQREAKVATMKRRPVDISKDGVWTIATEAREKSNAGSLRLPQAALDIIEDQQGIEGNPFVFPGSRLGRRKSTDKTPPAPPSFNSFSECKEEFDRLMLNELQKIAEARNDQAKLAYVAKVRALLKALAEAKSKEVKKKLRTEIKENWWVLHDLRRTAKSLMGRAGVRPDISQRVLGHAIPGVEGVYDQHSYSDEKADALNRLAHLVETIVNPPEGNVVALRR
jgi:integrase